MRLRLLTFGGFAVRGDEGHADDASATPTTMQRRSQALLAVLAAAGPAGVSRDTLVALLWPESGAEQGRNALRQTIFRTKRDLGVDEAIVGTVDLALNAAAIASDVGEFTAALARGERERAAALYSGPFLDGFHLDRAPAFETWLEGERARLGVLARTTFESLAAEATVRGDLEVAAGWRGRLAVLDPLDERVALAYVSALAAAGDTAGALRHARVHETLLRTELDVAPGVRLSALVASLRSQRVATPREHLAIVETPPVAVAAPSAVETRVEAAPAPLVSLVEPTDREAATEAQQMVSASHGLVGRAAPARRWPVRAAVAAALTLLAATAVGAVGGRWLDDRSRAVRLDPSLVVVAPFKVAGADSSYAYLRDGMPDLLGAALAGTPPAGWRVSAPASDGRTTETTPGAARRAAAEAGAGRVVVGAVVGAHGGSLTITASVLDATTGAVDAQGEVSGAADSLLPLVDHLAVQLVARATGEREQSVSVLAATPLSAARSYLAGRRAYRRGAFAEAIRLQRRALEEDSTFALAAVELCRATGWTQDEAARRRGFEVAWAHRDRLSAGDRLYLAGVMGPRYPAASTVEESRAAWQRAADANPDQPDAWFELGDILFHDPWLDGATPLGANAPAAAAFARALVVAPDFAPALQHLVQIAARDGDTVAVRSLGSRALDADSGTAAGLFLAWQIAVALRDGAAISRIRGRFPSASAETLTWVAAASQLDGVALDDGGRALRLLLKRAALDGDRVQALEGLHALAVNEGRLAGAAAIVDALRRTGDSTHAAAHLAVLDVVYADGDVARAEDVLRTLGADAGVAPTEGGVSALRLRDECVLGHWSIARGESARAAEYAHALRAAGSASTSTGAESLACAELLEAAVAVAARAPEASGRLDALDARLEAGVPQPSLLWDALTLGAARVFKQAGDDARALAAVRRRDVSYRWPHLLATQLREEGTLAAATGDRAGARRAFDAYLTLRAKPDASLRAEVARVAAARAELRAR